MTAKMKISRKDPWGSNRVEGWVHIYLDDQPIGDLPNKTQMDFTIPAGRHTLTARIVSRLGLFDKKKCYEITRPITFEAEVGELLHFHIRPSGLPAPFSLKKRLEWVKQLYAIARVN